MQPPGSLQKLFNGASLSLFRDYPLKEKTTWNVGGKAAYACFPESREQLKALFPSILRKAFPYTVLGGGSNVLVADKGFPGCVIFTEKMRTLSLLPASSEEATIYSDSGVSLGKLLSFSLGHSLSGLEFSVGIPGSLGGALIGNAGAQGEAIGSLVQYVDILLPDASVQRIFGKDIHWEYRFSSLSRNPGIILGCALKLYRASPEILEKNLGSFTEKRKGQPLFGKTAGSVFKNPSGKHAGRLLELSGCKGVVVGGARVSLKHANFIENYNGASAQNILDLIVLCRKKVMENTGIPLYPEVRFVGFENSEIRFT